MADEIKGKMQRNMSLKEWHRYVAEDIEYEKTVEDLPEGEGVIEDVKK